MLWKKVKECENVFPCELTNHISRACTWWYGPDDGARTLASVQFAPMRVLVISSSLRQFGMPKGCQAVGACGWWPGTVGVPQASQGPSMNPRRRSAKGSCLWFAKLVVRTK